MAVTKTITFGNTGTRPYGVLTVTETATSTANNTSTLSIKLVLKRPSSISSSATKSAKCTINGTTYTWSDTIGGSGDKTLISKTQTVTHNSDGSKSINLSASTITSNPSVVFNPVKLINETIALPFSKLTEPYCGAETYPSKPSYNLFKA